VLLEFRDTPGDAATATPETTIEKRAAFILNDGSIVDKDGISPIMLNATVQNNLFAVIHHRNHIPVMSSTPLPRTGNVFNYDFTDSESKVFGGSIGYREVVPGTWALVSGNGVCDETVDMTDKTASWYPQAGNCGYYSGDYNLDGQIDNKDKDEQWYLNINKLCQVPD
jgi:hypothetical protein